MARKFLFPIMRITMVLFTYTTHTRARARTNDNLVENQVKTQRIYNIVGVMMVLMILYVVFRCLHKTTEKKTKSKKNNEEQRQHRYNWNVLESVGRSVGWLSDLWIKLSLLSHVSLWNASPWLCLAQAVFVEKNSSMNWTIKRTTCLLNVSCFCCCCGRSRSKECLMKSEEE